MRDMVEVSWGRNKLGANIGVHIRQAPLFHFESKSISATVRVKEKKKWIGERRSTIKNASKNMPEKLENPALFITNLFRKRSVWKRSSTWRNLNTLSILVWAKTFYETMTSRLSRDFSDPVFLKHKCKRPVVLSNFSAAVSTENIWSALINFPCVGVDGKSANSVWARPKREFFSPIAINYHQWTFWEFSDMSKYYTPTEQFLCSTPFFGQNNAFIF